MLLKYDLCASDSIDLHLIVLICSSLRSEACTEIRVSALDAITNLGDLVPRRTHDKA